jgi:hypothetical protein
VPTDTSLAVETARHAWRRRVLRVGGIIQGCFAVFWLARGGLALGNPFGTALAVVLGGGALVALVLGIRATAGLAPRPTGADAKRLERSITIATVIELVAAFVLPAIVIAAGRSDLTLPSIAITIGPLLLWIDHVLHSTRYRVVGWALTIGPVVLAIALSGTALVVTTGLTAGALLLFSAVSGFIHLAREGDPPTGRGTGRAANGSTATPRRSRLRARS